MPIDSVTKRWRRDKPRSHNAGPLFLASWMLSGLVVARYYRRLVSEHGLSPQALDERSDEKSIAFYEHLFQDAPLPQPLAILDIGCGMGDVISYLQQQNIAISGYLGLDLVDAFVQACRQRYNAPYRFRRQNFIHPTFRPREQFGVVVNMGGMVSRVMGYEAYLTYSCAKMMRLATHAVLFNVITHVEPDSVNYTQAHRVGNITIIPKDRLKAILDRVTADVPWTYTIHDAKIYHDATDTFVCLRAKH